LPLANYVATQCASLSTLVQFKDFVGAIASSAQKGRVNYDPNAGAQCIHELDVQPCSGPILIPTCLAILSGAEGLVPDGGTCYTGSDCTPSAYCNGISFGSVGVCPSTCVGYLQAGSDCTGPGRCAPETACDGGVCAPLPGNGNSCDPSIGCQTGFYCNGGICGPAGGLGESCPCQAGFYCLSGTCATLVQDGGTCAVDQLHANASECAAPLVCFASQNDGTNFDAGACLPASDVNGHCLVVLPGFNGVNGCAQGLVCNNGTCEIPPSSGSCNSSSYPSCEIVAHYCDPNSMSCQPTKTDGTMCVNSNECQVGRCLSGGTCGSGVCLSP
jgi:hypothetical protein